MKNKKNTGWTGKSKARGFHFQIFLWVMRNGGMKGAYYFLYLVVTWFYLFDRKSNRYIGLYFREIWKFDRWKTKRYIFKTYYRFGQTFLDKVAILSGMNKDFQVDFNGHDLLLQMAEENTGGILVSAHIGNWEIAGEYLKNANRPVNVVMYDVEHDEVKNVLSDSFNNRSFRIIQVKEDFSHLLEIKRAIENKEFICMHGDRVRGDDGKRIVEVPLLGKMARFPVGPYDLAVRFNVPILYVFAVKTSDKEYQFKAYEPNPAHHGDLRAMAGDYVAAMEDMLRQYPDQWFNFYDYWRMDEKVAQPVKQPQMA